MERTTIRSKRGNWKKRKKKTATHNTNFEDIGIERSCWPVLQGNVNSSQSWNTSCSLCAGLCHAKQGF